MRLLVDTFGNREGLWTSFASPSMSIEEFESSNKLAPESLALLQELSQRGLMLLCYFSSFEMVPSCLCVAIFFCL